MAGKLFVLNDPELLSVVKSEIRNVLGNEGRETVLISTTYPSSSPFLMSLDAKSAM